MYRMAGRAARIALLIGVAATAAGCSTEGKGVRGVLGLTKDTPDPFNVYPREPLRMPDDMSALPEPRPGAPSPLEPDPEGEARTALGVPAAPAAAEAPSAGEAALVARAGAEAADPQIRDALDDEELQRESPYGLDTIFGFKVPDGTEEERLEAREERRRLLEEGRTAPNPPPEVERPSNVLF